MVKMFFPKFLHPCALDKSSLSIERVKAVLFLLYRSGGAGGPVDEPGEAACPDGHGEPTQTHAGEVQAPQHTHPLHQQEEQRGSLRRSQESTASR